MSNTVRQFLCSLVIVLCASSIIRAQTLPPECERLGFCTHTITTTAETALSVFAADLDGDGDTDVLSASVSDDKIAWYENTDGLGTFGPQQVITTNADSAVSVFAVDLDNDGNIDVLSASFSDDKIAWYKNTDGFGTFGPQQVITKNVDRIWSVFAADLDGDGDIDVLSASVFDDKIAWYENTDGLGTFGPQQVISTAANGANSVFAADLDGDGDTDVLSASGSDDKIAWYENTDGLGTFGPQQVITTSAEGASSVFASDLDGDGDYDVISASAFDDKIAWYENTDGLGTFGPQQVISTTANRAGCVFAVDLDGDGDTDILSASQDDDKIAWYENTDGLGTFGPQQVITTSADHARSVFAADLDGDGDIDVLSASHNDNKIAWYQNVCEQDCNNNDIPDVCDIADATSMDCNINDIPDECDINNGTSQDCQINGIPDECEDCCVDLDCEDDDNVCTDDVCHNGACTYPLNNICGACCDRIDGFCQNHVIQVDCVGRQPFWTAGETCGTVICDPALGACCNTRLGTCTNNLIFAECQDEILSWIKGEDCSAENCPDPFIPTISQWGLTVMTLLLLIGAKIYFNRFEENKTHSNP